MTRIHHRSRESALQLIEALTRDLEKEMKKKKKMPCGLESRVVMDVTGRRILGTRPRADKRTGPQLC